MRGAGALPANAAVIARCRPILGKGAHAENLGKNVRHAHDFYRPLISSIARAIQADL